MWTNAPYPYRVETRGLFEFQHQRAEKMNAGVFATVQVMGELSMLLLTIPVMFPAIMGLELWGLGAQDKAIWFGILVLMTVGIGMIAPPVGLNVYVVNNLARDVAMSETYRGVMPFLVWDALRVLLLLFFPMLSLGLVRLLF